MKARKRLKLPKLGTESLRVGTFLKSRDDFRNNDLVQVKVHTKGGVHPVVLSVCIVLEI